MCCHERIPVLTTFAYFAAYIAVEKSWEEFLFDRQSQGIDKREPREFKSSECFANREGKCWDAGSQVSVMLCSIPWTYCLESKSMQPPCHVLRDFD